MKKFEFGVINNTTYTGKDLLDFYTNALLVGTTISTFKLIPNVKSVAKIPSLNIGNIFQPESCQSTPMGDLTLAQKSITVCGIDINVALCNTDWESTFLSEYMKPGSNYAQVPQPVEKFILDLMQNKILADSEALTWNGNTAGSPASICTGLIPQLLADAAVLDVTSPITLTKANIIGEIERVYARIPRAVKDQMGTDGKTKVAIYISPEAADYYMQAQYGLFPALNSTNNGNFELVYLKTRLIVSPGMGTNTMVAGIPNEHFIFATDLMDDMSNIQIVNSTIPGSKNTHFIASFKWGVTFVKGNEIVLYGTGS